MEIGEDRLGLMIVMTQEVRNLLGHPLQVPVDQI